MEEHQSTRSIMERNISTKSVDVRLKSPFTAVIAGPTGSGKTRLLVDFIAASSSIADPPPENIVYCYDVWQPIFEELRSQGVQLHNGMIDVEELKGAGNSWLIIDDLMNEVVGGKRGEKNSGSDDLYTKHSHHYNISVFFVVQNVFLKNMRTISLNTHYFFLGKNPRDRTVVSRLASQAFPGKVPYVTEAFADATENPYSFMLMDLRPETPDNMRLIGNYGRDNADPMVIYSPTV